MNKVDIEAVLFGLGIFIIIFSLGYDAYQSGKTDKTFKHQIEVMRIEQLTKAYESCNNREVME